MFLQIKCCVFLTSTLLFAFTCGEVEPVVLSAGLAQEEAAAEIAFPAAKICFGDSGDNVIYIGCNQDALLIYRNGVAEGEEYPLDGRRLKSGIEIPVFQFGDRTYRIKRCVKYVHPETGDDSLSIFMDIDDGGSQFTQYCGVALKTGDLAALDVARFDGPLSVELGGKLESLPELELDGPPADIRVCIGTVDEAVGCWTVVSVEEAYDCLFESHERPVAVIEFPAANGEKIQVEYTLDEFC